MSTGNHIDEEDLEIYLLRRHPNPESIEEHLLHCELCQDRAATLEETIHVLREALRLQESERRKRAAKA
jgi:hypothetical protein